MSEMSFLWVPQNLKLRDQHQHMALHQKLMDLYTSDKEKFCRRLFTGVKTWIHHWDPESKLESIQWTGSMWSSYIQRNVELRHQPVKV